MTVRLLLRPGRAARSIVMSVSVCLSVCVSIYPRNYSPIFTKFFVHVTYGRGSVVL